MVKTFHWRVTSDAKATHKFNIRPVQSGNGYEQWQLKPLCPKLRSWDIEVVGQKVLIGEVKAFSDACGGVEPFNWRPPEGGTALVKASEYTETSKGSKVYELGRAFEEVLARIRVLKQCRV